MSLITVEKPKMLTPRVTPVMSFLNDFFSPGFPFETTVAMNPFGAVREFAGTPIKTWTPAVDIQRSDGNFIVTAELPGLKKEEVKVEMVDNLLVIEGERKKENKEDHEGYHRYERSYGAFYRAIQLPVGVKMDEVKAELENGLLKISIPVPEPKSNIRHVPVQETAGAKLPN